MLSASLPTGFSADALTLLLFAGAALLLCIGSIYYIVAGFLTGAGWGLVNLLLPGGSLIFTFARWDAARRPFFITVAGAICLGLGIVRAGPDWQRLGGDGSSLFSDAKDKHQELTADIDRTREEIFDLKARLQDETERVALAYKALSEKRSGLKTDDLEAVRAFNAEAAQYKSSNEGLTATRSSIGEREQRLASLLEERVAVAPPVVPASASGGGVTIYSASWCGPCKQAKAYLTSKGVPYQDIDVEKSPEGAAEFRRLGGRGVPLIVIKGEKISGFNQARIDQLLAR